MLLSLLKRVTEWNKHIYLRIYKRIINMLSIFRSFLKAAYFSVSTACLNQKLHLPGWKTQARCCRRTKLWLCERRAQMLVAGLLVSLRAETIVGLESTRSSSTYRGGTPPKAPVSHVTFSTRMMNIWLAAFFLQKKKRRLRRRIAKKRKRKKEDEKRKNRQTLWMALPYRLLSWTRNISQFVRFFWCAWCIADLEQ